MIRIGVLGDRNVEYAQWAGRRSRWAPPPVA
jgi:hypothetical protein